MADVVKLVTREERLRAEDEQNADAAHDEAIEMLERVLKMAKEQRIAGLAIALVTQDGHYGHVIPALTTDMARLTGAVASMQHALITSTED